MRSLLILAAVLALGAAPASAAFCEDWTRSDTIMSGAFVGAVAADVWTTERGLDRGHEEMNPAIGKRPSKTRLRIAAALGAASVIGVSCILPQPWRDRWQSFWIGVELHAAYRNALEIGALRVGVRF